VAARLVRVEAENADWWISLARATRRSDGIEEARAVLLRARERQHDNAVIEFNLACHASVTGRLEEARTQLQRY
jgi:Flp pilus assembly protein TadD